MKKVFAIALIATAMVACNNSGEKKTEEPKDTTTVAPVTEPAPAPAPDTTTAPAPAADTTAAPATN